MVGGKSKKGLRTFEFRRPHSSSPSLLSFSQPVLGHRHTLLVHICVGFALGIFGLVKFRKKTRSARPNSSLLRHHLPSFLFLAKPPPHSPPSPTQKISSRLGMTAKTSSASSGTRKKNAAKKAGKNKAQGGEGDDPEGEGPSSSSSRPHLSKKDKNAQKIKRGQPKPYTPPPKPPAPAVPDPLDALGLGTTLPAELVVVLRKLGKKDEVTRRRALEDFAGWLIKVQKRRSRDLRREAAEGAEGEREKEEGKEVELGQEGAEEEEDEDENADGWWVDMIGPVWVSNLSPLHTQTSKI